MDITFWHTFDCRPRTCRHKFRLWRPEYDDDEEKAEFEDENKVCQDQDHVHCDSEQFLHNISQ